MRKLLFLLCLICLSPSLAHANATIQGWCENGDQNVVTSGLTSSTLVQASYPNCTVTVLIHGGGLATIFSSNSGGSLSNPFTAQDNGQWLFYAAQGRYDVTLSGGGMSGTVTYTDIVLYDPAQQVTSLCTLSFSTTPAFNASICSLFQLTMTANVTSSTISGGVVGQTITISLAETGGPWTFAWPVSFLNPPTLTGQASKNAQFTFVLLADGFWHHTATGESQVFDTATNGNQLKINGTNITGVTGTGNVLALQNNANFTGTETFAGKPWVDPTSPTYGAHCDHSTDDSTALQTALNAAISIGAAFRIPPGVVCNFATGLVATVPVQIEGYFEQGANASVIGGATSVLNYTGTGTAININNGTSPIDGVHVRNLAINAPNVSGSGAGLACTYCNQVNIDNVQVISTNVPGFASAFDFSNSAGPRCTNCIEANSTVGFRLVNTTNADINSCNTYQNQATFLMGGSNLGVDIHDCVNIEAQNYVLDWDDTFPAATSTSANDIKFHHNFVLFDAGTGIAPLTTRQVLHISNTSSNIINISNLIYDDNAIYCPSGASSCGWAFNAAMANVNSTVTATAQNNWIFGFTNGGVTANSVKFVMGWINNQNLLTSGALNTDTGGTGSYCIVHYSGGVMTTCPIVTAGTVTTAGGLNDTSLLTQVKRIYYGGTPVTITNFTASVGWGTAPTLAIGANPVDATGAFSITAGTSPSANPTVTFTFADGTGSGNDVLCPAVRNDLSAPLTGDWRQTGITPTTATWTFAATPIAGNAYTLIWHCDFHN